MSISPTKLLEQDARPRVLLVGDVMLDRYVWGDVERISPEAPIPILRIERQEHRLGGAGSVAAMLATLGAETILASVVGDDEEGRAVGQLLDNLDINRRLVLRVEDRVTTVKERLLGRAQFRYPHQMMRVDRECTAAISSEALDLLLAGIARCLDEIDLVLVSDYNKGVCKGDFFPRLIELARKAGKPVVADPVKDADYRRYAGCTCITPNRAEAARALGTRIATPQEGLAAARKLLDFGLQSVIVTLDRDGMAWVDRSGEPRLFPARPRQVCDITGAGDMVLSVLGYMLAAGADPAAAIEVANVAGGLEVERLGVVPLTRQEILAEMTHGAAGDLAAEQKILQQENLVPTLQRLRLAGRRIVMTNGCFDLLHPGHVASLAEARRQGDCLLVAVNSDRSVRELKGPGRPVIDEQGRAEMLAALASVDYVFVFDEASVAGLVERVQPDVLVKSDQYTTEQVVGHETVLRRGGHVVSVPMKPTYSTTDLIDRIQRLPSRKRAAA
ncbi:MAG TPA: bifunctional heptose 7-phosphate kinase/heptose 1-phosphate adenyltransferase [Pirellulales bacterium]|jgi:D-beta-D-heptose 7-phosphate kinase/D-beta-D-heptose 1-phosphate adenosyltransferase|nr:bifunctional heptose 7-phosphate kinase/heptose 1-phosphate adenyltransferase [Pirellulales bacterium]